MMGQDGSPQKYTETTESELEKTQTFEPGMRGLVLTETGVIGVEETQVYPSEQADMGSATQGSTLVQGSLQREGLPHDIISTTSIYGDPAIHVQSPSLRDPQLEMGPYQNPPQTHEIPTQRVTGFVQLSPHRASPHSQRRQQMPWSLESGPTPRQQHSPMSLMTVPVTEHRRHSDPFSGKLPPFSRQRLVSEMDVDETDLGSKRHASDPGSESRAPDPSSESHAPDTEGILKKKSATKINLLETISPQRSPTVSFSDETEDISRTSEGPNPTQETEAAESHSAWNLTTRGPTSRSSSRGSSVSSRSPDRKPFVPFFWHFKSSERKKQESSSQHYWLRRHSDSTLPTDPEDLSIPRSQRSRSTGDTLGSTSGESWDQPQEGASDSGEGHLQPKRLKLKTYLQNRYQSDLDIPPKKGSKTERPAGFSSDLEPHSSSPSQSLSPRLQGSPNKGAIEVVNLSKTRRQMMGKVPITIKIEPISPEETEQEVETPGNVFLSPAFISPSLPHSAGTVSPYRRGAAVFQFNVPEAYVRRSGSSTTSSSASGSEHLRSPALGGYQDTELHAGIESELLRRERWFTAMARSSSRPDQRSTLGKRSSPSSTESPRSSSSTSGFSTEPESRLVSQTEAMERPEQLAFLRQVSQPFAIPMDQTPETNQESPGRELVQGAPARMEPYSQLSQRCAQLSPNIPIPQFLGSFSEPASPKTVSGHSGPPRYAPDVQSMHQMPFASFRNVRTQLRSPLWSDIRQPYMPQFQQQIEKGRGGKRASVMTCKLEKPFHFGPRRGFRGEQRYQTSGEKTYLCPVCGQGFPSHNYLANHMVNHLPSETVKNPADNTKVHLCRVCNRSFSRSDMLTRHMRLHTGIKPYECQICGQVFSRSDHLHTHHRTHTGEKPYKCPQCPYAAPRRDMITRHMRIHVKQQSRRGRRNSSSGSSDPRKSSISSVESTDDYRLGPHSLSSMESLESERRNSSVTSVESDDPHQQLHWQPESHDRPIIPSPQPSPRTRSLLSSSTSTEGGELPFTSTPKSRTFVTGADVTTEAQYFLYGRNQPITSTAKIDAESRDALLNIEVSTSFERCTVQSDKSSSPSDKECSPAPDSGTILNIKKEALD